MKRKLAVVPAAVTLVLMLIMIGYSDQILVRQAFAANEQSAYTPPAGSAERKNILDAFRAAWIGQGSSPITDVVFVVNNLKVRNGWAWLDVNPQSSDGSQQFEGEQGLLRKKNGKWKVIERTAGWDAAYFKKLKAKYPTVPLDIFPN
jgi:hypothetical protein